MAERRLERLRTRALHEILAQAFKTDEREVRRRFFEAGLPTFSVFMAFVERDGVRLMRRRKLPLGEANARATSGILAEAFGTTPAAAEAALGGDWRTLSNAVLIRAEELHEEIHGERAADLVRPTAMRLLEHIALDLYPDSPAVLADFWITDQAHWEALYYSIQAGDISIEDLDRILGDPEAITEAVNLSPSNPHKGIVFGEGDMGPLAN